MARCGRLFARGTAPEAGVNVMMPNAIRTENPREAMLRLKLGSTMLSLVIAGTLILAMMPRA